MRPTATFFLTTLSTECTDPPRAETEMKTTLQQLLRRNKSLQRRNFLEKIMKKGIGTNKAEAAAKTLVKDCSAKGEPTKEQLRKSFLQNIMKTKLEDAENEFKVEDFKFHRQKKRVREVVNNNHVLERAQHFSNREAEREWRKNKDKLDKKVKHLERKHKSKDAIKDTIRDVKISNRALGPETATPDPIIYNIDKGTVPTNVKEALKLHPT